MMTMLQERRWCATIHGMNHNAISSNTSINKTSAGDEAGAGSRYGAGDDFRTWQLALRVLTMPADTNQYGDIFGGWLLSQADVAGATIAIAKARGRVATVAVSEFHFLSPVRVGDLVELHARLLDQGTSSMTIEVDIRARREARPEDEHRVANGRFVYVAVGGDGRSRPIQNQETRLA